MKAASFTPFNRGGKRLRVRGAGSFYGVPGVGEARASKMLTGEEVRAMLMKAGVDISRLNPEIRRTLQPMGAFLDGYACEMTITSTYDGNHMPSSKHYGNDAYDIRRPKVVMNDAEARLSKFFGEDFDVVFEADHIHIEYDPKTGPGGSLE